MIALGVLTESILALMVNLASEEMKPVVQNAKYRRALRNSIRTLRDSIKNSYGDDRIPLLSQAMECIGLANAEHHSALVLKDGIDNAFETLQRTSAYTGLTDSMYEADREAFDDLCERILQFIWNEFPVLESVHKQIAAETYQKVTRIEKDLQEVGVTLDGLARTTRDRNAAISQECVVQVNGSEIRQLADRARLELEPRILPRVDRHAVSGSILRAARFSLDTGEPRVISVVGPAGYGKTSLLGHIYDKLIEQSTPWVAVVLCDLLDIPDNASTSDLETALGQCISGMPAKAPDVLTSLIGRYGKGVVMIDTLDLVLDRRTAAAICSVLRDMLDLQVTPILTCRDVEYDDLIQPVFDRLPSLASHIERYRVPPFEPDDIRNATMAFFRSRPELAGADAGESFAASIAELSADSRPLHEITQSPLLLAMLCDLFAKDGFVPEDITISKLYSIYWQQRVAGSRRHGANSPVCSAKRRFCINTAHYLFRSSTDKLTESASLVDLNPPENENDTAAIAELRSDGIIQTVGQTERVRFFHQTLEEYAIAQWLCTDSAAMELQDFVSSLRSRTSATTRLYRWPILRQLLSIVDEDQFLWMASKLKMDNPAAFRTVALAASTRIHRPFLLKLLSVSLERGAEYELILLKALKSAPTSIEAVFWEILLALVSKGSISSATEMCKQADAIIGRWNTPMHVRITQLFDAIDQRQTNLPDQLDESVNLRGQLVNAVTQVLERNIDESSLAVLRERYHQLSTSARTRVSSLHLLEGIPRQARFDLFAEMIREPLAYELRRDARWLLLSLFPGVIGANEESLWPDWRQALCASVPSGWEISLSLAIGKFLADDEEACRDAIYSLVSDQSINHLDGLLLALRSASEQGAGSSICSAITSHHADTIPAERLPMLADLIVEIAGDITGSPRKVLTAWVMSEFVKRPVELLRAAMALADYAPGTYVTLMERLLDLPVSTRTRELRRLIRSAPDQIALALSPFVEQHLSELGVNIETDLLHRYARQAITSLDAVEYLSRAALSHKKGVALGSSKSLREIAQESIVLKPEHLLPLVDSIYAEVRKNTLDALITLIERGCSVAEPDLARVCGALSTDSVPSVVQRVCDLFASWVHSNGAPKEHASRFLETLVSRVVEEDRIRSDAAKSLLTAVKVLALTEDRSYADILSRFAKRLLKNINFSKIRNALNEASSLLCAIDRLNPDLLSSLTTEGMYIAIGNQPALARAIRIVNGERSELLDIMLSADWCSTGVKNDILDWRGV